MASNHGGRSQTFTPATRTRRQLMGLAAGGMLLPLSTRQPASARHTTHATPTTGQSTGDGRLEVRKNGKDLSAAEREAFVNAVLALKKKPSPWAPGITVYDTFVLWHRDAFGCGVMAAHMGPAFLPWHRQFLRLIELELQEIEPSVTIPYWDWSVDQAHDAYLWQDDFLGGNGNPAEGFAVTTGPFAKGKWQINIFDYGDPEQFPYLIREFGAISFAPTLPTPEQVEEVLNVPVYDAAPWNTTVHPSRSFRNALEGWQDCVKETCDPVNGMAPTCTGPHNLHNQVHLWIAGEFAFAVEGAREGERGDLQIATTPSPGTDVFGTMAANTSINDPVFLLHHANIDRLWSEWMRRHGRSMSRSRVARTGTTSTTRCGPTTTSA